MVREHDEDLLMIKEYKSHSDDHFNAYIGNNVESQWLHIQSLLRTTKQNLLSKSDPVQALHDEFIKQYTRILNNVE